MSVRPFSVWEPLATPFQQTGLGSSEQIREEVSNLRRELDGAAQLARDAHAGSHKWLGAAHKIDNVYEDTDQRLLDLTHRLERLGTVLQGLERRAGGLDEVAKRASVGLVRLGSLLEGQEHRTAELGSRLSSTGESLGRLSGNAEAQARRVKELERSLSDLREANNDFKALSGASMESQPLWQAVRDLQEHVAREMERHAAGQKDVLTMVGQRVEELRSEQARQASEFEARLRGDCRRAEKRANEAAEQMVDCDRRTKAMESRLSEMAQEISHERHARKEAVTAVMMQQAPTRQGTGTIQQEVAGDARTASPEVSSRLEALEARFQGGSASCASGLAPSGSAPGTSQVQVATAQSMARLDALEARFKQSSVPTSVAGQALAEGQNSSSHLFSESASLPQSANGTPLKQRRESQSVRFESTNDASDHLRSPPSVLTPSPVSAATSSYPPASPTPRSVRRSVLSPTVVTRRVLSPVSYASTSPASARVAREASSQAHIGQLGAARWVPGEVNDGVMYTRAPPLQQPHRADPDSAGPVG